MKNLAQHKTAAKTAASTGRLGVAFDIGTTTVAGVLIDLSSGRELSEYSAANPQASAGQDVISRIAHAGKDGGFDYLRQSLFLCLNEIIAELCSRAGVTPDSITEAAFAGNTIMNHILLEHDITALGQAPFRTKLLEGRSVAISEDFPLIISPSAKAYTLANIGGYIGGDTVGMILATGMHLQDKLQLAIDIGTNGEIVLGSREKLIACSTAAGPAFEGTRIAFGMRAADGAIENVTIDGDVKLSVIGGGRPKGICGSGVISAVAALLGAKVIRPTGRLLNQSELPDDVPAKIRERLGTLGGQPCFTLAAAEESVTGEAISLTQRDIRELQLGKAAMRAGIELMLEHYGSCAGDIETVFIAGTFGGSVSAKSLTRTGIIPAIDESKIKYAGNAALDGAKIALASEAKRAESEAIARSTKCIDLAGRRDFQTRFSDSLIFPE